MRERPSFQETFFSLVDVLAKRSTCDRGHVACVAVRDNRVIGTGYAGSPHGMPHCSEVGHELVTIKIDGVERQSCIRTIHAEQNLIAQAARFGISLENASVYCTLEPCRVCANLLIQAGIKEIYAQNSYHTNARKTLELAGVELIVLSKETRY